jgi:hypothetical protein
MTVPLFCSGSNFFPVVSTIIGVRVKIRHQLQPEKITTEKKGTVVWPAMFFEPPEKNTTGKKRYSRLTDG